MSLQAEGLFLNKDFKQEAATERTYIRLNSKEMLNPCYPPAGVKPCEETFPKLAPVVMLHNFRNV